MRTPRSHRDAAPGVGTISDLKRAASAGVSYVRVATHRTEADVSTPTTSSSSSPWSKPAGLDAADEIDGIDGIDGIDVILIGPADLAASLGAAIGSTEHTDVVSRIFETALAAGRQVGIHCADADQTAFYRDRGARLLLIGTDVSFLSGAASADLRELPCKDDRSFFMATLPEAPAPVDNSN
ncbi:aldolase/citrate lyase family protein [Mycetocola sp.]|uniref:aldolase/citrate lyase family protein n=1 Tax=Mycetocola sp. TaxID=1871042 RepID=UPI00260602BE|nr:aldolase/citrate lyase family protein [Mycetocola sp.]MCU1559318.1 hpaI [Mycetocola sp.]